MENPSCLIAKNLKKSFYHPEPFTVLNGIDLEVGRGESLAITGRSGSGKSTLLHILGTLEAPSSGELIIAGKSVTPDNAAQLRSSQIGFVFQAFHLLDSFSVLQNVLIPARIARQCVKEGSPAFQRALELLDQVELSERLHHPVKLLSGGEKQRVSIARALINDPGLILADEPTGNLDQTAGAQIHTLLLNLTQEMGKSLIVVTHDRDLAQLCDRIFILKEGLLTHT